MPEIDLKKENKELYNPSIREPSIVEVPPIKFYDPWPGRPQYIERMLGCNGSTVSNVI